MQRIKEENLSKENEDKMNIVQNNKEKIEKVTEEFFSELSSSKTKNKTRKYSRAGVITIINSLKNGKRITLAKDSMENLNYPDNLQFSFSNDSIVIGEVLPENDNHYNVKKKNSKGTIYSYGLVNEITEQFNLDYNGIVSMTFDDVKYTSFEDNPVMIIKII